MKFALITLILLSSVMLSAIASRAAEVEYLPPVSALKLVREPGSNGVSFGCPESTKPPVLLIPEGHVGQTIAPHPTFYAFVPAATSIQFTVVEPGASDSVYLTNFETKRDSIVRLPLPPSSPGLKVGKTYWWYISVLCNPKYGHDRSYLQGWVQRVEPTPQLMQQLKLAMEDDRPALYATAGLWYDALASLTEQHQQHPHNQQWQTIWKNWLRPFGLDKWAGELEDPLQNTKKFR